MKGKFKEEINIINFPVQQYELHIIVTNNIRKSRNKRKKLFGGKLDGNAKGLFSKSNDFSGYIFIEPNASVNTISHESFHAVDHLMSAIDTSLTKDTNECYAYSLGYIVEKVYNFKNKIKNDKNI